MTRSLRFPRRGLARAACVLAAALAAACAAPTLPLPPPGAPVLEATGVADRVRLVSVEGAQPDAIVLVVNDNALLPRGERVGATQADERGSWSLTIAAQPGDRIEITQEYDGARSPPVSVRVPTTTP